jgi:hypothetical protein
MMSRQQSLPLSCDFFFSRLNCAITFISYDNDAGDKEALKQCHF